MPIVILSRRHATATLRRLREGHGLNRRDLARQVYVEPKTLADRERGRLGLSTEALLLTADVLGFDVALVPKVRRRATGTGWPA